MNNSKAIKFMAEEIPPEIIPDIISKLPIKSLMRFRCVCKDWRFIIDSPPFGDLHLTGSCKDPELLLIDIPKDKVGPTCLRLIKEKCSAELYWKACLGAEEFVMKSSRKKPLIQGSCNGLLCFSEKFASKGGNTVFLYNPFGEQVLTVQPGVTTPSLASRFGLGHDSSTNTYKLVHIFSRNMGDDIERAKGEVEVLTLGTGSWRKISERAPACSQINGRPVFAYGALHWTYYSAYPVNQSLERMIISFDITKEVFCLTPHPGIQGFYLVNLGGFLAMVQRLSTNRYEIWLMKDWNGKREWGKEYTLNMKTKLRIHSVVGLWEGGEILIRNSRGFCSYNPKTQGLRYLDIPGLKSNTECFSFEGSLISLSRFMEI